MRIILADDAVFMKRVLSDILTREGHTIVGNAKNGREAFYLYKELKPDLVFMDITMNDVNGIDGLSMIMDFDKSANVIMCSAMGQQALILESIQLGAKDFIVKPFTAERVIDSVNKIKI